MGGHNDNPSAVAFRYALRGLLTKQFISSSKSANCLDFDSTSGLFALEWSWRTAPVPGDADVELPTALIDLAPSSVHKHNIVSYIAGYVVRSLFGSVKCENCAQYLLAERRPSCGDHQYYSLPQESTSRLLHLKNRGGLWSASDAVVSVLQRCEQDITIYVTKIFIAQPKVDQLLLILILRSIYDEHPANLLHHHDCDETERELAHIYQLTHQLAMKYIDIRLKNL